MEKFKKYGGWVLGVVACLLFSVVLVKAAVGGYLINVENWSGDVITNSSNSPVNFGADDGTHITKLSVLETLDVTSTVTFSGAFNVGGLITLNGSLDSASSTRLASLVEKGAVTGLATTTVLTAAQVCNSAVVIARPVSDSGIDTFTVTMPNSSTLFADCLTTNGDSLTFKYVNQSALTSTLLAVGTGGPASASTTLLVQKGDTRTVEAIRTSSIGYVLNVR